MFKPKPKTKYYVIFNNVDIGNVDSGFFTLSQARNYAKSLDLDEIDICVQDEAYTAFMMTESDEYYTENIREYTEIINR